MADLVTELFGDQEASGNTVKGPEKEALIANATPITPTKVKLVPNPFEKDEEQYKVSAVIDGEERTVYFGAGSVDSRDRTLAAYAQRLDAGQEVIPFIIALEGKAQVLRPA